MTTARPYWLHQRNRTHLSVKTDAHLHKLVIISRTWYTDLVSVHFIDKVCTVVCFFETNIVHYRIFDASKWFGARLFRSLYTTVLLALTAIKRCPHPYSRARLLMVPYWYVSIWVCETRIATRGVRQCSAITIGHFLPSEDFLFYSVLYVLLALSACTFVTLFIQSYSQRSHPPTQKVAPTHFSPR